MPKAAGFYSVYVYARKASGYGINCTIEQKVKSILGKLILGTSRDTE